MADEGGIAAGTWMGPEDAIFNFGQLWNRYRWYSIQAVATGSSECRQNALQALAAMHNCADEYLGGDREPMHSWLNDLEHFPATPSTGDEAERAAEDWRAAFEYYTEGPFVCDAQGKRYIEWEPDLREIEEHLSGILKHNLERVERDITDYFRDSYPTLLPPFRLGIQIDLGLRPEDFIGAMLSVVPREEAHSTDDEFDESSETSVQKPDEAGPPISEIRAAERLMHPLESPAIDVRIQVVHPGGLPPSPTWEWHVRHHWNRCGLQEPAPLIIEQGVADRDAVRSVESLEKVARKAFANRHCPPEPAWPPDDGWHVHPERPDLFAVSGKPFRLSRPMYQKLLALLCSSSSGVPAADVDLALFPDAIHLHDDVSKGFRSIKSSINKELRKLLSLPQDFEVIIGSGRGDQRCFRLRSETEMAKVLS